MTPGHPADPPCLGTILPCDLVALREFWKSEGPSGQGTCSGMSGLHDYIVQRHSKNCKRKKLQITTMICWNDCFMKCKNTKCVMKICIYAIKHCVYAMSDIAVSRLTDHGGPQWILILRRKQWWICMFMYRLIWEKFFVLEKEYRVPWDREGFSFREGKGSHDVWVSRLISFTGLPGGERKKPQVGIFYFACFSKNGRNHSGEWFDFRQKALKTSIKSMHGQQTGKWSVWKIFVVTGWGIVVECG